MNSGISMINGTNLSVPPSFAGIVPVSPSRDNFGYVKPAFLGLNKVIKPGQVVFDIGASFGVMTALIAQMVGSRGEVHSFEANPEVTVKARELAEANDFSKNIFFVNKFVGNKSDETMDFYIVPSYSSVASTANEDIVKFHPDAIKTATPTIAIDDYCKQSNRYTDVLN